MLSRRPEHAHQGGLWEFPGGKLTTGEDVATALCRELDEELGITCLDARPLITVDHDYGDRRVWLDVWSVERWLGTPVGREGQPLCWISPAALSTVAMPAADVPLIAAIRLPAVYLVTPEPDEEERFLERVERCLRAGTTMLQFRAKSISADRYAALAIRVIEAARPAGALVLLNAAPELAVRLGAGGAHLTAARLHQYIERPLPKSMWLGVSCHDLRDLEQAGRIDADFAVLGPVRPTASHPESRCLGWTQFATLARAATFPVYAIGAMQPLDLPAAWNAGGQGIAAISSLWPA